MANNLFLTIHGHFYQPPRENPWTEAIERQESAAPFHDWNDKIASECYSPNAFSRILDSEYRIKDIVNNYRKMSFNYGPTLLSWLQEHASASYQAILQADKQSVELCAGHGNAIAQAYNHIILPLANARDKFTQIRWGLADFEHRFGRKSESIWLPETAVNYATLDVLDHFGFSYIILSPYQAYRIQPLQSARHDQWTDVSSGAIDTRQPYRCYLLDSRGEKDKSRYIDIFFYHGELSRGVGFEHLLRDAGKFADQIQSAFHQQSAKNQLISVCTDGESYGHHEPFGDMGLAYLLHNETERRGIRVTNFGEYLANNPPQWEVELKQGPNGEGTSWSCYHGVGRWYRDCGCHTGGSPEWNQKWRFHLREALNQLRDDLAELFEREAADCLKDGWSARDDYIQVILQRDAATMQAFLDRHGVGALDEKKRVKVFNLMEMQRQAMLMFTSCGWFFNDISGLETIQILQYAGRAIEIARYFGNDELEKKTLARLKHARSNIHEYRDGAKLYETRIRPVIVNFPRVVNHFAILSSVKPIGAAHSIYHFQIKQTEKTDITANQQSCTIGRVQVGSGITQEWREYAYLLHKTDNLQYTCYVKHLHNGKKFDQLKADFLKLACDKRHHFNRYIQDNWGDHQLTLKDVLYDEREDFFQIIFSDRSENFHRLFSKLYEDNKDLLFTMKDIGIPIPDELRIPAEFILSHQLVSEIEKSQHDFNSKFYKIALGIVEMADRFGFELNTEIPEKIFNQILEKRVKQLSENPEFSDCRELNEILQITRNLKLEINETKLQNILFTVLNEKLPALLDSMDGKSLKDNRFEAAACLIQLGFQLNFSVKHWKQKILDIEKKLSEDPAMWP